MASTVHKRIRNRVWNLYGFFILSLVLSFIPHWIVSVWAFFIFIGVFIIAYGMRSKYATSSFVTSHTTHIIRTIWAVNVLLVMTMVGSIAYLLSFINQAPILECAEHLQTIMTTADFDVIANPDTMPTEFKTCFKNYWAVNRTTFIISAAITLIPLICYLVWRIIKGFPLALKSHDVPNPKRWI